MNKYLTIFQQIAGGGGLWENFEILKNLKKIF
jgi:hypothetical protein